MPTASPYLDFCTSELRSALMLYASAQAHTGCADNAEFPDSLLQSAVRYGQLGTLDMRIRS